MSTIVSLLGQKREPMPCHATLDHIMSWQSSHIISCYVLPHCAPPWHVLSCHTTAQHVMSQQVMSHHVMSCHIHCNPTACQWSCCFYSLYIGRPLEILVSLQALIFIVILTLTKVCHGACINHNIQINTETYEHSIFKSFRMIPFIASGMWLIKVANPHFELHLLF